MVKRLASAALWFIAVGWGFNLLSLLTGMPSGLGMILATGVAVFVGLDPLHMIWPARVVEPEAHPADPAPVGGVLQTQA